MLASFSRLSAGIPVDVALAELAAQPELWNQHTERTAYQDSPHRETSDIWLRFRDPKERLSPTAVSDPHFAVFYPAWKALPALRPIVFDLMASERAVYLGGMLITRLPPGREVHAHNDRGSWHAEYLNTKVYVILQANDRCVNWCEDERVTMRPGEAWQFDNLKMHGVINGGKADRLALIVTLRCEND
jgi:hypothetical protein